MLELLCPAKKLAATRHTPGTQSPRTSVSNRAWQMSATHLRLARLRRKRVSEILCHLGTEPMHRCLCDAVADNRIHSFSNRAERRLVNTGEIQLRFARGQWVNRKFAFHEGEEPWQSRRLPFQSQRRGRH